MVYLIKYFWYKVTSRLLFDKANIIMVFIRNVRFCKLIPFCMYIELVVKEYGNKYVYSLFWILVRKNKICWICVAFSAGSFFIRSGTRRWSSRPEVFCKNVVHKDFVNFTENACVRVLFLIKSQGETCNFVKKKRLWHRSFSLNFAKFLSASFF